MNAAEPVDPRAHTAGGDAALASLAAHWARLVAAWNVADAQDFGESLASLLDSTDDQQASRAGDLAAYLAVFADGALLPNRQQLARLDALAGALFAGTAAADNVVPLPAPAPRAQVARATVCLFGVSDTLCPGLSDSLAEHGYGLRHFAELEGLLGWLHEARPGVLMIDAPRLRNLPQLVGALGDAAPGGLLGPALIVLSAAADLSHRLLAMRAGAAACFGAPLDSYRIVARVEELLGRHETTPYRVLIVDADREHGALCGRWLVDEGMTARLAFDAPGALSALAEFRPDIVLIDDELPDARGHEVAQLVRQQPGFSGVPVVLYGEHADDARRFNANAAGADEVLLAPLKPRHLTSVIRSQVQRAQWLHGSTPAGGGRDARTGMCARHSVIERLGRPNQPAGSVLLLVAFDRAERIRESVGLSGLPQLEAEVAQAFREALASADIAAPLRDFAYLVLAARDHRDAVTELAERLRLKLSERRAGGGDSATPITASIGITRIDDGEGGADSRVARAEAASLAAARVGGNRVLWYEAGEYAPVRPDPQLAVRAALARPWHDDHVRCEFRPIVPLAGKLTGQFELEYLLVGAPDPGTRAPYAVYAPVAAELGALPAIERRRLAAALDARQSRLRLGRQVRLFMPIRAASLLGDELVDWLLSELKSRNLSGTGLTLELDSAELVDRRAELLAPLGLLRAAGVRLGLFDFGRDWAAVHVLKSMPLDYLRLDPELVLHTTSDKATGGTVLALVRKAHALGSVVIAPAVDSIDRAHVLLRLAIDYGCGDGLGRASAEAEFDFSRPIW
jgi:PleD family two-component response regulator/EAL domain-containing protein (putative c-di-GMP-specific phosphodiesterase class I)